MIGPLTATARTAALAAICPPRSCQRPAAPAKPGANAMVRRPTRTTLSVDLVGIEVSLPSCEPATLGTIQGEGSILHPGKREVQSNPLAPAGEIVSGAPGGASS